MKGCILNDDELWDMLNFFKNELEEYIGNFDGEIFIQMENYSVVISLDENKYVCSDAVIRTIENYFINSQFNKDEFVIDSEMKYSIDIKYKGNSA